MTHSIPAPAGARLAVGDGHQLYLECRGNPAAAPMLVLHGGPGSGCGPRLASLYDLERHWLVLVDQRGAGLSLPAGETRANTTAHLIADLERVRRHLGIERWCVSGGSWGATLALAYAAAHRQSVSRVLARSVFMPGAGNVRHFFDGGAEQPGPARQNLLRAVPEAASGPVLPALAALLRGRDARRAALAWWRYEQAMEGAREEASAGNPCPDPPPEHVDALIRKYRLQAHYLLAGAFLEEDAFLSACESLSGLPVTLIHGRQDRVCPPANAERIHQRIPGSRLIWVEDCGHQAFHPGMVAEWGRMVRGEG